MASPLPDDLFGAPSRRTALRAALGAGAFVCLAGCSEVQPTPRTIKWGRDLCEHCHMVFADRRYVAQIWDKDLNRARIYDDFGCAALAAVERGVLDREDVPFWVTDDSNPANWLDARKARYRDGQKTPMDYGHSAGMTASHKLDFRAAVAAVREKEACAHRS